MEELQIQDGRVVAYTGREELVQIPQGVHTIGEGAFKACVSVRGVELPESLQRIEAYAFKGCRRLESIQIPSQVSSIGSYAFHRCHALKKVILPEAVEELLDCTFLYCDSLVEVQMPGVRRLGKQVFVNDVLLKKLTICEGLMESGICDVFTGCGMIRKIQFAGGVCVQIPNAVEAVVSGGKLPSLVRAIAVDVLRMMELDGRCLVRFLTNLKQVEVPEGIEKLGKSCFFDKRGIVLVKLPKSLKEIDSRAFRNCINLEEVRFAGKEVLIHEDAFKNCTSLKTVQTADGRDYICTGLQGLTEPDVPGMVRQIYYQVMGNFRLSGTILLKYLGLESRVVVPEGVTKIAEGAFAGNEAIDRVILPESLIEIGADAFKDCLLLQTIRLPEGLQKIGPGAFDHCVKLIRAHLPVGVRVIEERTFRHCLVLREIQFSEEMTEIGESAFYGCAGIKKLTFPESLTRIGEMAFYQCGGLTEIRLWAKTEYVESLAFARSGVKKVWMGSSGIHYGRDVFGDCKRLRMLICEEGVRHLPDKLAYGCTKLDRVILPESIQSAGRHVWEGTPFLRRWSEEETEKSNKIFWDGREWSGKVTIPKEVQIIAGGAFYGNTKVTEITLPDTVCDIGAAAFKGCKSLQKIWMPAKIHSLEAEVFSGCSSLQEIVLTTRSQGDKTELPVWESVGTRAFYRCENLRRVRMDGIKWIGKEAFAGCWMLRPENINHSLQIGERAFEGTRYLESSEPLVVIGDVLVSGERCEGEVCLPEGIVSIAPYAFAGNSKVTKVHLSRSLVRTGEGAFFGCDKMTEVVSKEGLSEIGSRTFERCGALREAEFSAQQVGSAAFANCRSLQKATVSRLSHLEERMFENCSSLEVCVCEEAETVGPYCFSGCQNLREFSFVSLRWIGSYAFAGCDALTQVKWQDGLCLEAHALEDCGSLTEVELTGEGQIILKEYALSGCTSLQAVILQEKRWETESYQELFSARLPEVVRLMFHSAFSCFVIEQTSTLCAYLGAGKKVKIPKGIRRIETEVFRDRLTLQEVEIPDTVEEIGARAFHGTGWLRRKQEASPMVVVHGMLLDGSGCTGEVVVPKEVRLICGWAFANGLGIEKIRFLSDQVRVEAYAFRNCIHLREMTLPDGTCITFTGIADRERDLPALAKQAVFDSLNCFKTSPDGVLVECTGNISCLTIAYGITAIGEGAFEEGNLLTKVTLPKTLGRIGRRAFAGCKWLEEVRGATCVKCIEAQAFAGCGSLRKVELSDALQEIGARAFEHCTALEEILLPEGLEEIPEKAFYRCHSLRAIRLPSTLKKIGKEAFAFCKGLTAYEIPDGVVVEERAFVGVHRDGE